MSLWLVLTLFGAALPPAMAEQWMVLQSTDPRLHQGRLLDGQRPIGVAEGQTVTLVSRSGREVRVSGPFRDVPDVLLGRQVPELDASGEAPAVGATRDLDPPAVGGAAPMPGDVER